MDEADELREAERVGGVTQHGSGGVQSCPAISSRHRQCPYRDTARQSPLTALLQWRFSNGPLWIEDFAANFGLATQPALSGGTDFAVGGANAGSSADRLPYQADLYLLLSVFSRPDPRALYVVFGGGNDV
jgi:hypothetical protein